MLDARTKMTPATHTASPIGEPGGPAGPRAIQLELITRRGRGLHPISPVPARGTQRILQPLYLASRFFDSNSTGILLRYVSTPVRPEPTVKSVGNVEVVHDRLRNMAVSTDVLIRFAHLLGVLCSTPSRDTRMNLRESQSDQESVALETPATVRQERVSANPGPRGGRAKASRAEIVPSRREKPAEMDLRNGFQPLSNLPQYVPRRWRSHWLKLADQASTSYRAAVELKCLDCCAWQRTEARRCEVRGCPLWAVSRRIFGSSSRSESRREQAQASGRANRLPRPAAEEGGGGTGDFRQGARRARRLLTGAAEDRDEPAAKGAQRQPFDEEGRR